MTTRMIGSQVRLQRTAWLRFPVEELVGEEGSIARLGRDGSLRLLFGPGRRVIVDGMEAWRIKSVTYGPYITPIITSSGGLIAKSAPLHARRSYGLNLRDDSYTLIPLTAVGLRHPVYWALRRHETEVAMIDMRSRTMTMVDPIPVAAALMAFTLIKHGIAGEGSLMPKRD